ncbi:MAG: hypothetical protein H0V13_05175 [Nocardioidaceae bacterium]|jgi:hypothetical protein|nr:hypothetical protein [Nocardioidaceae bacterium]
MTKRLTMLAAASALATAAVLGSGASASGADMHDNLGVGWDRVGTSDGSSDNRRGVGWD